MEPAWKAHDVRAILERRNGDLLVGGSGGGIAYLDGRIQLPFEREAGFPETGVFAIQELPGGDLLIEWRQSDDHVLMTGPVAFEYEGRFDPALFAASGAA